MKVETLGEGEPEHAVIGSLHGDEPCGKRAIERFLSEDWEVEKPVKFIVANEEALGKDTRYIDADLNRSFPGDLESEKHEERLAAEILSEVEGATVLDLHSTHSYSEPFAIIDGQEKKSRFSICRELGVEKAVHYPDETNTLAAETEGLNVECGYQGSEEAAENAYRVLLNFLASEDIIDRGSEESNPDLFGYQETVKGGDWEFVAENFQKVEKGQVYACKGDKELVAEETFYPVLMSTDGYEHILGHKAEKIE